MSRRTIAQLACGFALSVCMTLGAVQSGTSAEPVPPARALFIGIDGCRFDAIRKANAPNLHRLIREGAYTDRALILGERYRGSDTVSGPGWSSLLTGVWADKHGVDSNRFENPQYRRYPHFFARIKQTYPQALTASSASWPPIARQIVSAADVNRQPPEEGRYVPGDRATAETTIELLQRAEPTAIFAYFGQVDEHGHQFGFAADVPEYVAAIERVDAHVGDVLTALRSRPNFATENWLVVVGSDHGGLGKDHAGGHARPEILHSFAIVHGGAAQLGRIADPVYIVDLPVTLLAHLGIAIDPQWQLDGRAIGLKPR